MKVLRKWAKWAGRAFIALMAGLLLVTYLTHYDSSYDKSRALLMTYVRTHPVKDVRENLYKILDEGLVLLVFQAEELELNTRASVFESPNGQITLAFSESFLYNPWFEAPNLRNFDGPGRIHVILLHEFVHIRQATRGRYKSSKRYGRFIESLERLLPYLDDREMVRILGLQELVRGFGKVDTARLKAIVREINFAIARNKYASEVEAYAAGCGLAEKLGVAEAFNECVVRRKQGEVEFRRLIVELLKDKDKEVPGLAEEYDRIYRQDAAKLKR